MRENLAARKVFAFSDSAFNKSRFFGGIPLVFTVSMKLVIREGLQIAVTELSVRGTLGTGELPNPQSRVYQQLCLSLFHNFSPQKNLSCRKSSGMFKGWKCNIICILLLLQIVFDPREVEYTYTQLQEVS